MNKVKIRVKESSLKFINYLVYNCICYNNLNKYNKYYELIVSYEDYKRISRRYETSIVKYYGKKSLEYFLTIHKYMIISVIISLFVLKLLTMTIFDIKVNTSSIEAKNMILSSLKENGISVYKRKKSFKEINEIKKKILSQNEDNLEWIEIKEHGCIYIVDVTLRVKNEIKESEKLSSIYSKNDGVIKHIVVKNGTKIKEVNEYVKKGDLLISGNIYKDEVLISRVEAKGEVYAETWYFVTTSIPFKYKEFIKTNKKINHYYLDAFNKKFTLIGKYESNNTKSKTSLIIDKPYLPFKLYKEVKEVYKEKNITLTDKQAYNLALEGSENKIKKGLNKDEYIISKKVLKKRVNSSKMEVEVFYKVYENIGVTSKIDEININGDKNGISN